MTGLIALRIWIYQRQAGKILGSHHTKPYTTFMTIFIESAALYSVVALGSVITDSFTNEYAYAQLSIWYLITLPTQVCDFIRSSTAWSNLQPLDYCQLSHHIPGHPR